jgi:hypothetical protein
MKENVVRNKSFEIAVSVASWCRVPVSQVEYSYHKGNSNVKTVISRGHVDWRKFREVGNSHSHREFCIA